MTIASTNGSKVIASDHISIVSHSSSDSSNDSSSYDCTVQVHKTLTGSQHACSLQ
jgi:hypothetical protein